MEITEFKAEHAEYLIAEGGNNALASKLTPEVLVVAEMQNNSYTGFIDGEVVFCAGLTHKNTHCAEAWAILHQHKRKDFLKVFNAINRLLDVAPYRRVEAVIDYDFKEGHRWARALGFELEAERMKAYLSDGKDASLYSRVS